MYTVKTTSFLTSFELIWVGMAWLGRAWIVITDSSLGLLLGLCSAWLGLALVDLAWLGLEWFFVA